jgi:hypothetical protein
VVPLEHKAAGFLPIFGMAAEVWRGRQLRPRFFE